MTKLRPLHIVHLYPREMNIYGDTGNRIVIEKRLQWRGIDYQTHLISVGDALPKHVDIIIGGGGQDASQERVAEDLFTKQQQLVTLTESGTVMLMVCGMYQLFGTKFVTAEAQEIKGIGILPVETIAKPGRIIGNIHVEVEGVGLVVGYENHSGRTYLLPGAEPMAKVLFGTGNNDDSMLEGCRKNNIFGTYMHGPVLSKNPELADHLISLALKNMDAGIVLEPLDDTLMIEARNRAKHRPR